MWKLIIGIVVVLVVLGGGAGFVVYKSPLMDKLRSRGDTGLQGTPVKFEASDRGKLVRTVSAPGSIEPKTMVKISSQVSAEVLALPFREGDEVKKNDVVVRLDPQNLNAALELVNAGLRGEKARHEGVQAMLINARLERDRFAQLLETGDATQAEFDGAEANYLSADSNLKVMASSIEQAEARIKEAEEDLNNTIISAAMDGVITALNTEVGETVIIGTTNNPGSVIMEIADLSEMLVKAQVDESNIAPIEAGQTAKIFVNAYQDREFSGTIQRIGLKRQVAPDGTGIFEVEILLDLEEGDRLYSGLTASVDIAVESFYDVVRVPSQAVLDRRVEDLPEDITKGSPHIDTEKTFCRVVYRMVEGKAVATPVTVGPSDLTHTVILGGLEDGVEVVSGPYRELVGLAHDQKIRDENAVVESDDAEDGAEDGAEDDGATSEDGAEDGASEGGSGEAPSDEGSSEGASADPVEDEGASGAGDAGSSDDGAGDSTGG